MARTKEADAREWTEEMVADLIRLYAIPPKHDDFMPVGAIATYIRTTYTDYRGSLTRNAVMSKVHRMGLNATYPRISVSGGTKGNKGGRKPSLVIRKDKLANANKAASRMQQRRLDNEAKAAKAAAELAAAPPPFEPQANNLPYLEAQDHHCMWPVGEAPGRVTIVCGNTRYDNGSKLRPSQYCAHHSRIGSGGLPQKRMADPTKHNRGGRPAARFS